LLLSATLIVRNEEKFLDSCLASIRGFVDEIVVVDTGSTDATKDIAVAHGARVSEFPWAGDFSQARNHALSLARGEWILYIDADEQVRSGDFADIRARLHDPSFVAFHVSMIPMAGLTSYRILRLFRNQPAIRFLGVIHENIWPSLTRYVGRTGGRVGEVDLLFEHRGYEGDQAHKHARNLPLLKQAVERDPSRIYAWCHLADVHLASGDPAGAEQAWRTAIEVVRNSGFSTADDSLPYVGLLQFLRGRNEDVSALLREALTRFPWNLQLVWLQGRIEQEAGRFASAIPAFERLAAAGETGEYDRTLAYDRKLLDVLPYESLATCHFRLGRYRESRAYYERAAAVEPGRLEFRVKQLLCSRLEREAAAPGASCR
jgi:glycosyltransferase involved in cell wall biosynthesis